MRLRPLLASALVLPAACGGGAATGPPGQLGPEDLTAQERQAFVYAAAIRHLVDELEAEPGVIFVLDSAVEEAPDLQGPTPSGEPIPRGVQDRVREELALLPRVKFVAGGAQATEGATGPVRNHGVLIALGAVPAGRDRVEVEASTYRNRSAASSGTLVLERRGLRWRVTEVVAVS